MMQPIIVVLQRCAHHDAEFCAGIFASIVHLPSNCIISIRPLACFYTMQEALWCATALHRPEQCVPLSDAGRGCPQTPARSSPQVAHAPQNECDCAAVARSLFGRPER